MKFTRRQLRRLINEVYKDYESQKQGERARINIPGLQSKLSSIESSGKYADEVQANQLALGMGSKELELPTKQLKINLGFEIVKNKARAYLQSTLDYCDWINSSDERFTPEDKETMKQMERKAYDLGQEYKNSLFDLHKDLSKRKVVDDQGHVTFGTPEQHEFYMIINYYISRPFDDHGSLLAAIAKEEPKYAWMGRPVKPGMCQQQYMYRMFGPY
jgi:hypothetical protein